MHYFTWRDQCYWIRSPKVKLTLYVTTWVRVTIMTTIDPYSVQYAKCTLHRAYPVAAPDHKIRQCNQRSTLFPGRAGGRTEGPERGAGSISAKHRRAEGVWGLVCEWRRIYSHSPLRGLKAPRKIFKNKLWNRVFSAILQTEMISSAVSARARLWIRHHNCYL